MEWYNNLPGWKRARIAGVISMVGMKLSRIFKEENRKEITQTELTQMIQKELSDHPRLQLQESRSVIEQYNDYIQKQVQQFVVERFHGEAFEVTEDPKSEATEEEVNFLAENILNIVEKHFEAYYNRKPTLEEMNWWIDNKLPPILKRTGVSRGKIYYWNECSYPRTNW